MVSRKRSILKSVTFRTLATITTMLLIWLFTGHVFLAIGIGALDFVSKLLIYYLHERTWDRIRWGR